MGMLAERVGSFNQKTRPLHRRFGFRRRIPFDMHERVYQRDLQLDLLTAQRRRRRQALDLGERSGELLDGFNKGRAADRPLSRFAPLARGVRDEPSISAVTSQQLRLLLRDIRELAFQSLCYAGVQFTARFAQERAVCRVLYKRVLEQVRRVRSHTLSEEQACLNKPVERALSSGSGFWATAAKRE